ncbi:arrestin red cell-like [Contarinia nasturtii]|uniref:arrestin red cell-like n=1 Tax=Contarinia nasturtii TaxID=265458 RepID=UPI0012D45B8E|nr:arrestin red cell-like [Contarinia nasturtii]
MHPKPEEDEPSGIFSNRSPSKRSSSGQREEDATENASNQATTGNLIQLDGDDDYKDDDIIFEDFARLRLKGETEA